VQQPALQNTEAPGVKSFAARW